MRVVAIHEHFWNFTDTMRTERMARLAHVLDGVDPLRLDFMVSGILLPLSPVPGNSPGFGMSSIEYQYMPG